tara:strand:+ start:3748 stop:4206 length:459 start_codon:yes stop_codon:yes gene_type:complete
MILLREATLDDLSPLLEFEKRLIEYERDFTPNLKKSDFNYYNLKSYIKDPEISVVVAEEKNKLIASGYALIRENKIYKIPDKLIFLGFMYVIPEYRGRGINKKVLDYLIAWGKNKGINEFQLTVYAQNESAINAYKKYGFSFETITMRSYIQ